MTTEELNGYLFTDLVYGYAHKAWRKSCEQLTDQGVSIVQALAQNPPLESYIPEAIGRLTELKRQVFVALEGSASATQ
jgi:hypothetical protein